MAMDKEREAQVRGQFERWITAPPFEKPIDRWPSSAAWHGNYKSYEVHLAWDAWQECARIAALTAQQEPVAIVDASDDGYFAEILPDRSVKVGQELYAAPPSGVREGMLLSCIKEFLSEDCPLPVLDDQSIRACVVAGKCGCVWSNHYAALLAAAKEPRK